jgi:uncharacterized membrane protein
MLSILLINENKIVSRLFQLSSQKHNYDLEEVVEYSAKDSSYNAVFIDSKLFDQNKLDEFRSKVTFDKLTYLGDKGEVKPVGFDLLLEKPFLPTDFVNLMNENFKVIEPGQEVEMATESLDNLDELDLDSLEEIELDDDLSLESIDEIGTQEELDLDNDLKDIDPKPNIETPKDELADIVSELDDIDKLSEDSIVAEDLVKESIQEVKDSIKDDSTTSIATAAVAATAAATVAKVATDEKELENLNILDGIETIESEEDYLVDSEPKVDKLADEFDSLNEVEMQKVMSGESQEEVILDEQIIQEDDKVVESNDLEDLITRAVAKALTKEMIHEALKDMDIVISLKPKDS